jgi:CheY-like chemotaxis protein
MPLKTVYYITFQCHISYKPGGRPKKPIFYFNRSIPGIWHSNSNNNIIEGEIMMDPMKKILVVDDNKDILQVVELILKSHGMQVEAVSDGTEAIERIGNFKPDLVLLDVYLGGVDGRDICKELKSDYHTSNIPVIMFSAQGNISDVKQFKAQDFISKPFDVSDLMGKINYQLSHAISNN